jgi:hypothetical protein
MDKIGKIGDYIKILSTHCHNSLVNGYNPGVAFKENELYNRVQILDVVKCREGNLAYKVKCNLGITYVRPQYVELVETSKKEIKDYKYLIPVIKELNKIYV